MIRTDIINTLIKRYGYTKYLEIGVRRSANFNQINIASKDGVDPEYPCNYKMTSDEFFALIPEDKTFDIVFIDGLHLKEQVLKDVGNSLSHLSPGGTIVIHDCNPINKEHTSAVCDPTKPWNGTVWEAFVELRMTRDDLSMYVVNTDHGCGIIRDGVQETVELQPLTYELLERDRIRLLNLISVEDFMQLHSDKLVIKGGLDEEREVLSRVKRENHKSIPRRIELAKELESQALNIDHNKGFLTFAPSLFDTKKFMDECLGKHSEFVAKKIPRTKKGFLTNNLYLPTQMLPNSAFLDFVKHPKILATVSKYIGHLPILQYVGVWHSTYMPGIFRSSQLFHCDWEDVISAKVFVNLNDVTPSNGALYALDATTSKDIRKKIGYTFTGEHYRVPDETIMSNMTDASELINFSGPPGTVSFVDTTRCFHYGSRMEPSTDRLVAVISYMSPAALNISQSKFGSYRKLLANENSEIEKYLFGHIW